MKHLLKVVLICLLLMITACDSTGPSKLTKTPQFQDDTTMQISSWQELDGKPLTMLLEQFVFEAHRLNPFQTKILLQTLEKSLRMECRELCEVRVLN